MQLTSREYKELSTLLRLTLLRGNKFLLNGITKYWREIYYNREISLTLVAHKNNFELDTFLQYNRKQTVVKKSHYKKDDFVLCDTEKLCIVTEIMKLLERYNCSFKIFLSIHP
jgi:hypothetical protein